MKDYNEDNNIESYIGGQIRKQRRMLGMNQSDLADKINVTFQQIQKYEKGTNKIKASSLYKLSKIMNVNINYFFEDRPTNVSSINNSLNEEPAEFLYNLPEENSGQDALKLVKIYNKIPNDKTKKKLLGFLKSLTEDND